MTTATLTAVPGSLLRAGDTIYDRQPDGTYRPWRQIITNLSIHGDSRAMLDNGNIQPFLNTEYTVTRDPAFVEDEQNTYILNVVNRATMDTSLLLAGLWKAWDANAEAIEQWKTGWNEDWKQIEEARKYAAAKANAALVGEG